MQIYFAYGFHEEADKKLTEFYPLQPAKYLIKSSALIILYHSRQRLKYY